MVYELAYVQIEGTWHEIAADETTACGLVIPYPGTLLTRDQPDKVHCGENATKAEAPTPTKAKAKK